MDLYQLQIVVNRASSLTYLIEETYQEFYFFGSPRVCSVRALTYKTPAVVSHHALTPVPLIPLFHRFDALMESFSLLLAPCSLHQDCQENNPHGYARSVFSQWYSTQASGKLEAGCPPGVSNSQLWYCQENWSPLLQMHSMHPVLLIALCWWRLDLRSIEYTSFDFFLCDGGKFHTQVLKTVPFLSSAFTSCFIKPGLMWSGGRKTFSGFTSC